MKSCTQGKIGKISVPSLTSDYSLLKMGKVKSNIPLQATGHDLASF
jgi:hypothetical protein